MNRTRYTTQTGIRTVAKMASSAILAALAAGCSAPETAETGLPGEADALHLRLTIETDGYTRTGQDAEAAVLTAERRIDDVLVLLFEPAAGSKPGRLLMCKEADSLEPDKGEGNGRRFDVRLSLSGKTDFPDNLRLSAIANGAYLAQDLSRLLGKTYSEIRNDASLWRTEEHATGNPLFTPFFTMWGASADLVTKTDRLQNADLKVVRDMAKVTVMLSQDETGNPSVAGDPEFRLAYVLVYNRRGDVSVLPDLANMDYADGSGSDSRDPYGIGKPSVKAVTEMKKDERYQNKLSATGEKTISLYVPEQDVRMGANPSVDDTNALLRPALIVGGYNGGDTDKLSWYRVEFAETKDGDRQLTDILRNHHYRVTVKGVNGPGEKTPELAYNTLQTNVDTDIVDWKDVDWDVEFDGGYWIAAQREVTVGASKDDITGIVLRSNVSAESWTFSWDQENLFEASLASEAPEDAEVSEDSEGSEISDDSDDSEATTLIIKALSDLPEGTDSRRAVLTVTVTPKLKFVINVTQKIINQASDSSGEVIAPWGDNPYYGTI